MSSTAHTALVALGIGLGASVLMDGWNLLLKRVFGIPSLDYCLLGRWFLHMPRGTFVHAGITRSAPRPLECPAGWLAHYTIGVVLALVFLVLAPAGWLERPSLAPALAYGLVTVAFPLGVLQPALGLGFASARTPRPMQARVKSLGTHLVFGLGLYLGARVLALLPLAN